VCFPRLSALCDLPFSFISNALAKKPEQKTTGFPVLEINYLLTAALFRISQITGMISVFVE
jgi:hypothetical protein